MITVRVIFVETTLPLRRRPRIETRPVQGHFLSILCQYSVLVRVSRKALLTNVSTVDSGVRGLETKTDILVPPLGARGLAGGLRVKEKGLLLESALRLHTKLDVRHVEALGSDDSASVRGRRANARTPKLYLTRDPTDYIT